MWTDVVLIVLAAYYAFAPCSQQPDICPNALAHQVMPLFHLHAISINLLATAVAGAALVAAPRFDAPLFYEWLLPVHTASESSAVDATIDEATDAPLTLGSCANANADETASCMVGSAEELSLEGLEFGEMDDPDADTPSPTTATAPVQRHGRPAPNWYSAVPSETPGF